MTEHLKEEMTEHLKECCIVKEHQTRCYKCNTFITWEDLGHADCIEKEALTKFAQQVEEIVRVHSWKCSRCGWVVDEEEISKGMEALKKEAGI